MKKEAGGTLVVVDTPKQFVDTKTGIKTADVEG